MFWILISSLGSQFRFADLISHVILDSIYDFRLIYDLISYVILDPIHDYQASIFDVISHAIFESILNPIYNSRALISYLIYDRVSSLIFHPISNPIFGTSWGN